MRRADGLALLSALVVVCVFYGPGVFAGQVYAAEDTQLQFFSSRNNLYNVVRDGSLSFWEDKRGLGTPRFGEPEAGYFSPFSALFYLLPTTMAFRFYPALMLFALWGGTYALFRQRQAQTMAAAFGAYSFVSLGMILHHVEHPAVIETLVWTPLSLFFMDRYFLTGRSRWAILCSLAYTGMMVAGSAQYLVFGSLLLLGWGLSHVRRLHSQGDPWLPSLGWMAAVAGAGILVSLPGFLPVVEYAQNSHRTLLTSTRFFDSSAGLDIVLLSLASEVMHLVGAPQIPGIPYNLRPGLSLVTLLFAALAIKTDRRRGWLCLSIGLLLLGMMGDSLGVSKLLGIIPGGNLLRQHIRMLVPAALLISWLAVQGMDDLMKRESTPSWLPLFPILWVICLGFGSNRAESRFAGPELYQRPSVIAEAKDRIVSDPSCPPFWTNCAVPYGQQQLVIWTALSPRNYYACMIAAQGKMPTLEENLLQTTGATMIPVTSLTHPLLRCFNLNTIVGVRKKDGPLKGQPWTEQVQGLGPFYVVQKIEVLEGESDRWEWLRRTDWDPASIAVVSSPAELAPSAEPATFNVVEQSADRQELKTSGGGLLVSSGLYYPGWEVRIDGQPAAALEVNGALRGVIVPPGDHTVSWRYTPRWLNLAIVGFCLGGLLLIVIGFFARVPEWKLCSGTIPTTGDGNSHRG